MAAVSKRRRMSPIRFVEVYELSRTPLKFAEQLGEWGVIPKTEDYPCPKCGQSLSLSADTNSPDGVQWYCGNTSGESVDRKRTICEHTVDIRKGTFFARSRLAIRQIVSFVIFWVYHLRLSFICSQLAISRKQAVDWSAFCRNVCVETFMTNKQKLGGVGKTVEIDESQFGKRKYHRGNNVEGQWVFGGYERGSGKVFMVPVDDRSADTLLPIIQEWIEPGTTIISDCWRAYDCLSSVGYVHLRVNNAIHFKDPETGAHTNAIKSSWRAAKATMSASGRGKKHLAGNLARYMFIKRCNELDLVRNVEFLRLVGQLYNPLLPPFDISPEEENLTTDESDRFSD